MKITLLRLSRRAACLVLAGGLLTSCSLLPAASPRHEGTASSQAPQYYSDAWLSDDSLHYLYSYAGSGGGTILRGGRVLYKASSSDSIQLLKDTLTGETATTSWPTPPPARRSALPPFTTPTAMPS